MNILILGASGFIGQNCFNYFSQYHHVLGIDVQNHLNQKVIIDVDFSKSKALIQSEKFDVIINCAGSSNIQHSFTNPQLDYDLNTRYVEKILICIQEYSPKTKLINLSSAAVYGNPKSLPIKETDPVAPLSPYGKHKFLAENLIQTYAQQNGVKGLSLRIFSAYGVGLMRQFFYDLSQKFMNNPHQVVLAGTGKESRDFIYIDDIISAFDCLISKAEFKGEIYNLAGGNEVFIEKVANQYAKIFDYNGQISFTNIQLEGYPLNWVADISTIKKLGFKPNIELERGMHFYSDWIKLKFKP